MKGEIKELLKLNLIINSIGKDMERELKKLFCSSLVFGILLFTLFGCKGDDNPSGPAQGIPVLSTTAVTGVTASSATSGGNITSDGGSAITVRGVCWSTNQTPTIADSKTTNGTGTGSFVSNITGLTENTTYYVRAYATNGSGTGYGGAISFVPQPPALEITYIANGGFLIKVGDKKILVDALFTSGYDYPSPSVENIGKMRNAQSPFNNCGLILTTHSHLDHCDPSVIVNHLTNSSSTIGVVSSVTRAAIRSSQNTASIDSRLLAITPNLYNSIDTTVNGIRLKVMRLRHEDSDGSEGNIGFLIKIDGFTIFHSGDSNGYQSPGNPGRPSLEEYNAMGLENETIDVAILNRGFFAAENLSVGKEIITQCLKPRNIVLFHFTASGMQNEVQTINNTIALFRNTLPNIVIFNQLMEKKTFTK